MRVEILIATYVKDLPYLRHNLKSIAKHATGFSGVTLAVARAEEGVFRQEFPDAKLYTYDRVPDPAKWQIHSQAIKCCADAACLGADFVLHTDSDCIFTEPVSPADYFVNGKPVMLMQSYATLPRDIPWRPVVEKTLGHRVDCEFMRRHPQVNPIGIYPDLRQHISSKHRKPFEVWVLEQKPSFPWGFTEHNTIGAFAWHTPYWHEQYHWVNLDRSPRPPSKLMQFWSHSPPEVPQGDPNGGRCTPLEVINKALA